MTENQLNNRVPVANLASQKPLIKIQGILTSQIQLKSQNTDEPYYYSFIRLKGQSIDLPVIFKIKDEKPMKVPRIRAIISLFLFWFASGFLFMCFN